MQFARRRYGRRRVALVQFGHDDDISATIGEVHHEWPGDRATWAQILIGHDRSKHPPPFAYLEGPKGRGSKREGSCQKGIHFSWARAHYEPNVTGLARRLQSVEGQVSVASLSVTPNPSLRQRKREVPSDFDIVAGTYDQLVRRNPGYIEHLALGARRLAGDMSSDRDDVHTASSEAGAGVAQRLRVLDLCCGTGLSTEAVRAAFPSADIVGLDASAGMLDLARAKPDLAGVEFVLGDAGDPAAALGSEPFDAVFMAYGIRNLEDPDTALRNIRALMKPGAPICFHEYSVKGNPRATATWTAVAWGIIIPSGWLAARHTRIYRYLWRSVLDFDSVTEFEQRVASSGFIGVHTEPVDGWQQGIVHHLLARAPDTAEGRSSVAFAQKAATRPPGSRDRRARRADSPRAALAPRVAVSQQGSRGQNQAYRVTVVGGGLAGVSAACVLAERGVKVTLHEAGSVLGGRLASWPDRLNEAAGGAEIHMERGFHAAFRMYYNLRTLLRRVDPELRSLAPATDYPLVGPNGEVERFSGLPRRPPFNLAALLWRSPTFHLGDLRRLNGDAAGVMASFDGSRTYDRFDRMSAKELLDMANFPPAARQMLFEVFAHSFFNPEEKMSAAEMLSMFHLYFTGSSEGILFDTWTEPFGLAVWAPLERYLAGLGVDVRLDSRVESLSAVADHEGLVIACNVAGLRGIVRDNGWIGAGDLSWRSAIDSLVGAPPFVVWRLWLDRDVNMDRPPFVGTAGMGILDNISCQHRYQGEAHRWHLSTGGAVVELHAYALPEDYNENRTRAELLSRLHEVWPETATCQILDDRFLWRDDCPAFRPGSWAARPGVVTPEPRVMLAGDLVKLDFPTALMDRAVASGFLAANHLLEGWGVEGEAVYSVPLRGPTAGLEAFQRRRAEKAAK